MMWEIYNWRCTQCEKTDNERAGIECDERVGPNENEMKRMKCDAVLIP